MIRAGENVYALSVFRRTCVLCGKTYNRKNSFDAAYHARGHADSGLVNETVTNRGSKGPRYEFLLTEKGAAAANARPENEQSVAVGERVS